MLLTKLFVAEGCCPASLWPAKLLAGLAHALFFVIEDGIGPVPIPDPGSGRVGERAAKVELI